MYSRTVAQQPGPEPAGTAAPRSAVRGLLLACHPAPTLAVTAAAAALAVASGRDAAGCVLAGAAVLTGQLSVGWSNDRIDVARDIAARRADKPLAAGAVAAGTVARAAAGALLLCVVLSLANGLPAGSAHLAGVLAAWGYNLRFKRTLLSWLPYAVAFALLPAFVTLGLPGHPWPSAWLMAAGGLLGAGAHFTNVLPDIDTDLAADVRGLPQRLGVRRSRVCAAVALLGASTVLLLGPAGARGPGAWAGLGATGALALVTALPVSRNPASRLPFLATLALAGSDVALLLLRGTALS